MRGDPMMSWVPFFPLYICLSGIATAGAPAASNSNTVTIPLEVLRTRHIAVQTRINGEGPFRLVLDTGAPITFINRRLAAQLGLIKPEAASTPSIIGMGGQVSVKTLEVGDAKSENVPVIILDHPIVEMIGQIEGGIDGIVGYTFWSRYRMTLDYQAKQVTLAPTTYEPNDVLSSVYSRLMRTDTRPPVVAPGGIWGMRAAAKSGRVEVLGVTPGWPAHTGGLRSGDLINTLDRRWVNSMPELLDAMARVAPGRSAEVQVVRRGKTLNLMIAPRPGV
jgi:hypothetical protein